MPPGIDLTTRKTGFLNSGAGRKAYRRKNNHYKGKNIKNAYRVKRISPHIILTLLGYAIYLIPGILLSLK